MIPSMCTHSHRAALMPCDPRSLPLLSLPPTSNRQHFKGRGHEASDLRRLLEMYKRWGVSSARSCVPFAILVDCVFPHP
jgi:hypothetical protein